jgi:hypothetical protein
MAGRTSGIKTAADFFSELRIMQINTCWKDNSEYFPMSMALFSGTEYTGCGNQIKSTVISVIYHSLDARGVISVIYMALNFYF